MKNLFFVLFLLISGLAYASAPSSTYTYVSGTVINPTQVQTNENNIYTYLQAGVDTYANGSISNSAISTTAGIVYSKLNLANSIISTDISSVAGSSFINLSSTPSGAGIFPVANVGVSASTSNIYTFLRGDGSFQLAQNPIVKCSNTQTSGTNGGASTTGSWQTYPLNTKDTDTLSIASLSGNQVTLPAGTYNVRAIAAFHTTNGAQIRLFNVTDSAIILNGTNTFAPATNNDEPYSSIEGRFSISTSKTVSIQYQTQNHNDTSDLGNATSFGTEVYGYVVFEKVN